VDTSTKRFASAGARLATRQMVAHFASPNQDDYADKSTIQKKVRMPLSAKTPKVSLALSTTCVRRLCMNLLALSPQQAQM
jgi:hypothetical protein